MSAPPEHSARVARVPVNPRNANDERNQRKNNFVFRGKGGRWEKLAFTFYSDLCEISWLVRDLLCEIDGKRSAQDSEHADRE